MSVAVVQEAATDRLLQLDADQRPVITPGRTGRITATIRPACLRLLTGTVQQPNRTGTRFDFLLDEASTERLRLDPNNGTRFRIAKDEKRYRLAKVPASCIELTDPAETAPPGGSAACCPRARVGLAGRDQAPCRAPGLRGRPAPHAHPPDRHRSHPVSSSTAPIDTAEHIASQALAAWGLSAHTDDDAGNSWLVIGLPQGADALPSVGVPHVVFYVFDPFSDEDGVMVDRPPSGPCDHWCAVSVDSKGVQRPLITRPVAQLTGCVDAIADWLTSPQA
ncbi:hypothetical protein ACFWIZ_20385 [Streptomyces sp. NPDC127044]